MARRLSLRVALSASLALGAAPCAQDAGLLRLAGRGEIGTSIDARVARGTPAGAVALVLTPEAGRFSSPGLTTDCFSVDRGFTILDLTLNAQGAVQLPLPIPRATELIGVYLVGQGFELAAALPRTNCASFAIAAARAEPSIFETFETAARHDTAISAARWATDVVGAVLPSRVGGSGVLGSFDHRLGTLRGTDPEGPWVFDTDDQTFPATATLFEQAVRVTDGRFEFLDFAIPPGVTVRFEGSKPARILVSGAVRVEGTLEVDGLDVARADGTSVSGEGQSGGGGGAGGGSGGDGGDLPTVPGGVVDGAPGEDLRVTPLGPLDGRVAATGGRGSAAVPSGADELAVTYAFWGFFSNQIAGGGGGGGYASVGAPGEVLAERLPGGDAGPSGAGGVAIVPPASSSRSREAMLNGGSGGGGAGVHPYDSVAGRPVIWARGSGGAGGGGALLLACSGDVVVASTGVVSASGGNAASRDDSHGLILAPGGGGSGGSVLVQAGGRFRNDGVVRAVGGTGGRSEDLRATPGSAVAGGSGGDGVIRVETRQPTGLADLGEMQPPAGAGTAAALDELDPLTLAASGWYRLPAAAAAEDLRYELYTVQDALPIVYSDRQGFGSGPVGRGATPVVLFTRFAQLDARGRPIAGTEGPWTEGSAQAPPDANGIQFLIYFDRAAGAADLRVETVRLTF